MYPFNSVLTFTETSAWEIFYRMIILLPNYPVQGSSINREMHLSMHTHKASQRRSISVKAFNVVVQNFSPSFSFRSSEPQIGQSWCISMVTVTTQVVMWRPQPIPSSLMNSIIPRWRCSHSNSFPVEVKILPFASIFPKQLFLFVFLAQFREC